MKGYLRMKADETLTAEKCEGVSPDPVIKPMLELLAPDQATESLEEFQSQVTKGDASGEKSFQPFGSKIAEFKVDSKDSGEVSNFEVFLAPFINTCGVDPFSKNVFPLPIKDVRGGRGL